MHRFHLQASFRSPTRSPPRCRPAPIEVGGDRDLTVNNYLATMVNDEGGGFLNLVAGHCTNIRFTNRTTRTISTNAYCNFKDRDGDVLYVEYTTGESRPIKGISNKWTIVSGTGKYDGITGKAEDTNSNNVGEAGVYQAAGKLLGSYQITHDKPPPTAENQPN